LRVLAIDHPIRSLEGFGLSIKTSYLNSIEPNQVNLKPGQRGTMVWQFTQPGKVDFACTEPGHLEAGMAGQVEVAR
jgi:uncharacterized cupredoxin-like copper-binding protein